MEIYQFEVFGVSTFKKSSPWVPGDECWGVPSTVGLEREKWDGRVQEKDVSTSYWKTSTKSCHMMWFHLCI